MTPLSQQARDLIFQVIRDAITQAGGDWAQADPKDVTRIEDILKWYEDQADDH